MRYRERRLGRAARESLIAAGLLAVARSGARVSGQVGASAQVPVAKASDAPTAAPAAATHVSPAEARLRGDVTFLADDAREGRAPGTKGIEAAADYIAGVFKELGLKTAPGRRRLLPAVHARGPAEARRAARAGRQGARTARRSRASSRTDFSRWRSASAATLEAMPIVFAGYGITAKDDELKLDYDDYAGSTSRARPS